MQTQHDKSVTLRSHPLRPVRPRQAECGEWGCFLYRKGGYTMFKVLVSDPISDLGISLLVEASDISIDKKTGLSEDELVAIIGEYDALLVRSQTRVTEKIMNAGNRLKVIGRAGVGVDNIDLEAATKRGIIVINAPDGNTITTCEHTFAMMMAL